MGFIGLGPWGNLVTELGPVAIIHQFFPMNTSSLILRSTDFFWRNVCFNYSILRLGIHEGNSTLMSQANFFVSFNSDQLGSDHERELGSSFTQSVEMSLTYAGSNISLYVPPLIISEIRWRHIFRSLDRLGSVWSCDQKLWTGFISSRWCE